jgi:tetratricopeptide (TPR) repeat protein
MFLTLGRTEEAVQLLLEATRQNFTLAPAWHHLGQAHRRLQRPEEAIEFFRRSLEVDPTYEASYLSIGETLLEMDRKAEAVRYSKAGRTSVRDAAAIEGDYLLD